MKTKKYLKTPENNEVYIDQNQELLYIELEQEKNWTEYE